MKLRERLILPRVGLLALALALVSSSGCGSSTSEVRIMNASPGEGAITATIGSNSIATSLDYGTASSYTKVNSGSVTLDVEQSSSSNSVLNKSLSLSSNDSYTILIANYSTSIAAVTLTDNNSSPSSGNFNLRIMQAAPGLGAVDVYVVSPGTSLSSVSPNVSDLSFESASSYLPLSAGTYEVYFTATGQKQAYVDSGPLSFSSGQVRTVVGLDGSAGGYTSAVLSDLN
jgi:Domain of unknown function (DUF4397)